MQYVGFTTEGRRRPRILTGDEQAGGERASGEGGGRRGEAELAIGAERLSRAFCHGAVGRCRFRGRIERKREGEKRMITLGALQEGV